MISAPCLSDSGKRLRQNISTLKTRAFPLNQYFGLFLMIFTLSMYSIGGNLRSLSKDTTSTRYFRESYIVLISLRPLGNGLKFEDEMWLIFFKVEESSPQRARCVYFYYYGSLLDKGFNHVVMRRLCFSI